MEGADPSSAGTVIHVLPVNRKDRSKIDFYLSIFASPQPKIETPLLAVLVKTSRDHVVFHLYSFMAIYLMLKR